MHRLSTIMRHRPILRLLLCGVALCLLRPLPCVQAQAREPESSADRIRFERIGQADGLAGPIVRTFLQDRQGFLWIATNGGLDRYDGYTFEHMLPGIDLFALAEDRQGRIWAGTRGRGLISFDPVTGRFIHYLHNPDDPASLITDRVDALHVDSTGILWAGTPMGLERFDPATSSFTHYQHDPNDSNSLSRGEVRAIYEDHEGVLWVGTMEWNREGGGLNRFDPATETFTRYQHDPEDSFSLIDDGVSLIKEDRQGTLYVGTCGHGLHRYDPAEDHFERLMYDPAHPVRLHAPQGVDIPGLCGRVSVIHEDATGAFWVGTRTGGVKRFDRELGTVTHYVHDPSDPHSLSTNEVIAFFEDRQGTRWMGTFLGGINKIVPDPAQMFRALDDEGFAPDGQNVQAVKSLFGHASGQFWIGTRAGDVYRVEASDAFSRIRLNHVTRLPSLDGKRGVLDQGGVLWGGNQAGLYRFDLKTGQSKLYTHDPNDPRSLTSGVVYFIHEGAEGVLWIGTAGGLSRLDRTEQAFTRYLPGHFVTALYEDDGGTLWVGSNQLDGLSRYDRDEDRFTLVLPEVSAVALHEDAQGRFWVGTYGTGLLLFDRDRGVVTSSFTIEDGLLHDSVWGIAEDDDGHLWLLSAAGLSRFDPAREQFLNYSNVDGFPNTREVILKRQSGEIVTGGAEGVTVVLPHLITTNLHAPEVVVTGVRVFDEPLQAVGLLPALVELSHDQNDLTFEYVGLHFAQPEKNRYAYQLAGYDADWREVGTERKARYTSLRPGDYIFRVKAANADGVWTEQPATLTIAIKPPWWQTTWAYLLYGSLLLGGVFAADRIQRRRLIRREQEKAQAKELAQAREIEKAHVELQQSHTELRATQQQLIQQEKMASLGQLTAGIAHEIKNPLNFVNNFAEVNEELADELQELLGDELAEDVQEVLADLKQNAQLIAQHGKRADGIVRAMMQHAAGGKGQREPTDINQLVSEHIDLAYHGKRAQMPDLQVEIEYDLTADAGTVELVPQEIGRVLLNLLGNAFDAVHAHASKVDGAYSPTVSVSTRHVDSLVEIRVSDNGPGIPEEIREKIFEPFFTTKPTGSGTGLGLSLSYDIVTQGHGGTLIVGSEEGQGATFIITLPVSKTEPGSSA